MRSDMFTSLLGLGVVLAMGLSVVACGDEPASTEGCGSGATMCGSSCTVTAIDPNNCGACGTVCGQGEVCSNGQCALTCNGGATMCGQSCVDTLHDPAHCGGCDKPCGADEVCNAGTCAFECSGGAMQCGQSCVDTQNDPMNCGSCGKACDTAQEVCAAGQCVAACGAGGQTKCGDICVDIKTDVNHCGQCDKACAADETCTLGSCTAITAPKGVYTMTNDAAGNRILAFPRAADGTLSAEGTFTSTGGTGTGAGLGNQGGLVFNQALQRFFAVNAGNDTISMLQLELDGHLTLLSNVAAGGVRPISITVSGDTVYVVNMGNMMTNVAGNISGFKIMGDMLVPIANSSKPLSAANPNPAQIQFSPDGKTLVVSEKGTNVLSTYTVSNGVATGPIVKASAGMTPFGFDFDTAGHLIVSEAAGGMANGSTTSSYSLGGNGMLTTISSAVPTTRSAACWATVAGNFAYVSNAGTSDITGFKIAANGSLTLLDPTGVSGQTASGATDDDATDDNAFLYVVTNAAHVISIFQINADGSLTKKPDFAQIPTAVSGIVAR